MFSYLLTIKQQTEVEKGYKFIEKCLDSLNNIRICRQNRFVLLQEKLAKSSLILFRGRTNKASGRQPSKDLLNFSVFSNPK
jgi:hypothetical protein